MKKRLHWEFIVSGWMAQIQFLLLVWKFVKVSENFSQNKRCMKNGNVLNCLLGVEVVSFGYLMISWGFWPSTLQPTDWAVSRISLATPRQYLKLCQNFEAKITKLRKSSCTEKNRKKFINITMDKCWKDKFYFPSCVQCENFLWN